MAAGLALNRNDLVEFRSTFQDAIRESLLTTPPLIKLTKEFDGKVRLNELDNKFFNDLEKLEPFGPGNPEPTYIIDSVEFTSIVRCDNYLCKGTLCDSSGITFDFSSYESIPEALEGDGQLYTIVASPRRILSETYQTSQIVIKKLMNTDDEI